MSLDAIATRTRTAAAPPESQPPARPAHARGERGTSWGLPGVAFMLFATFAVPSDSVVRVIGAMGFPGGLAAMALFAGWVLLVATGAHRPSAHRNPTTWILFAYTISTVLAYIITQLRSPDGTMVRGADRALMMNAACAGVVLVVAQGCNSRRAIRGVIDVLLVGTAICTLVALVDGITGMGLADSLKSAIPGFAPNSEYAAVGSREGLNRVSGTALHPIELGVVSVMVLAMGIARCQTTRGGARLVRVALTGVVALGIPLSVSRSALLGAVVVLGMLFACYRGVRRWLLLSWVFVASVGIWLVIPRVVNAFVEIIVTWRQDDSIAARVFDYEPFLRTFSEDPWFGHGVSTFHAVTVRDILDNQYLGWLLERGALGTLGPLALMVAPMVAALLLHSRIHDAELRTYAASLAGAAAVGLLISGTFDSFGFPMFVLIYSVLVGLLGAVWVCAHRESSEGQLRERIGVDRWNP